MPKTKDILLNVYLDLSREGTDLRNMAYAKAILWVLYAEDKPLTAEALSDDIAQLVDQKNIPVDAIESSLNLLKTRKLIVTENSLYILSDVQKLAMEKKIKYSSGVTDRILLNRFPNKIDKVNLKKWFDDVNGQYFSAGADKLIALHSNNQKPVFNVESILKPVILKHNLKEFESELLQGYREFLTSTEREEEEKVFNLISSLFSSRLVAANLAPEVLSIDKYKNSEMILDTNVLFALNLQQDEKLNKAFNSLGSVAKSLNSKFLITKFTIDEYENARRRERESFIALVSSYSETIFEGMNKKNDFVKSMFKLGCKTPEDVELFFDVTLELPKKIGDEDITTISGPQLRGTYYMEELDKELLGDIISATDKNEARAIHDLRLTKLARKHHRAKNSFVLTLDSQMEAFSLKEVGDKEDPLWLSLYSLIQILAINGGGPDFDPSDLSPLIRMFIEFEESTNEEKYDERDLLLLLEKTERVNDLSETQMVNLLNKLHRTRLQRSADEAVREVTLELDRALRQKATKIDEKVKQKQVAIDTLEAEKDNVQNTLTETQKDLLNTKTKNIYIWFSVRVVFYILLSTGIFWLIREEIVNDFTSGYVFDVLTKLSMIAAILGFAMTDYFTFTKSSIDKAENENGKS